MIKAFHLSLFILICFSSSLKANWGCQWWCKSESQEIIEVQKPSLLEQKKDLILKLHEIGVVKIGNFELKSGLVSPIYFDPNLIFSYPKILQTIASYFLTLTQNYEYDKICGF